MTTNTIAQDLSTRRPRHPSRVVCPCGCPAPAAEAVQTETPWVDTMPPVEQALEAYRARPTQANRELLSLLREIDYAQA